MREPVELYPDDFLGELSMAPKWNIFQNYLEGYFLLAVIYSFGTWTYTSLPLTSMTAEAGKDFYRQLQDLTKEPSIAEVKEQ